MVIYLLPVVVLDKFNCDEIIFICLTNQDVAEKFILSVIEFTHSLKKEDRLLIYIRYEQNYQENAEFCNHLYRNLTKLNNVAVRKYIRDIKKYGMWGNKNKYYKLLTFRLENKQALIS